MIVENNGFAASSKLAGELIFGLILLILIPLPGLAAEKVSNGGSATKQEVAPEHNLSPLKKLAERLNFDAESVELVWLGEDSQKMLALFQPPFQAQTNGAVIVMLGGAKILDPSEYARSVREVPPASGWAILKVQIWKMTRADSTPINFDQALSAAHSYLVGQNYSRLVLVADD